jgi:hypothetical protein
MGRLLMWLVVVLQIGVPVLLAGVLAVNRQPSRLRWLGTVASFGMVVSYLLISSRWDVTSLYLRAAIPVLFVTGGIIGWRRIRTPETAPGRLQAVVAWTVNLGLIVLMSGFLWFSLRGWRTPAGAVDLTSPLRGSHVVLNGGDSPFTNNHFRVHPQDYALDIVGLNALGARAFLLGSRRDLESYVIYGEPVFSPCDGRIALTSDGAPDLIPPARDTDNPAGNHVLIECGDVEVLLAHLRPRSLHVTAGDVVRVGDLLGEVGNSGNTSEPHLHIHAERGGDPGVILDGEAVPITIQGRFLVRNSVLLGRAAPSAASPR